MMSSKVLDKVLLLQSKLTLLSNALAFVDYRECDLANLIVCETAIDTVARLFHNQLVFLSPPEPEKESEQ